MPGPELQKGPDEVEAVPPVGVEQGGGINSHNVVLVPPEFIIVPGYDIVPPEAVNVGGAITWGNKFDVIVTGVA